MNFGYQSLFLKISLEKTGCLIFGSVRYFAIDAKVSSLFIAPHWYTDPMFTCAHIIPFFSRAEASVDIQVVWVMYVTIYPLILCLLHFVIFCIHTPTASTSAKRENSTAVLFQLCFFFRCLSPAFPLRCFDTRIYNACRRSDELHRHVCGSDRTYKWEKNNGSLKTNSPFAILHQWCWSDTHRYAFTIIRYSEDSTPTPKNFIDFCTFMLILNSKPATHLN